ncbi:MAG TPA: hypothetical protein VIJ07_08705, partial [Dermatophilaceae bacterium]
RSDDPWWARRVSCEGSFCGDGQLRVEVTTCFADCSAGKRGRDDDTGKTRADPRVASLDG